MIPAPELATAIDYELGVIRARLGPWLPAVGVRVSSAGGVFTYHYDAPSGLHYIDVPAGYPASDPSLPRIVAHESGHLALDELGRRRGYVDVTGDMPGPRPPAGLTDPAFTHDPVHEWWAEIWSRTLGNAPSYAALEPYTRPSAERTAYLEGIGRLAPGAHQYVVGPFPVPTDAQGAYEGLLQLKGLGPVAAAGPITIEVFRVGLTAGDRSSGHYRGQAADDGILARVFVIGDPVRSGTAYLTVRATQ